MHGMQDSTRRLFILSNQTCFWLLAYAHADLRPLVYTTTCFGNAFSFRVKYPTILSLPTWNVDASRQSALKDHVQML